MLLALSGLLIAIETSGGSPSRRFDAIWPFKDQSKIWCQTVREVEEAIQETRVSRPDRPTSSIDPYRYDRLLLDAQRFAPKSIQKDVDNVMKYGSYGRHGIDEVYRSAEKIEQTIFEICGLRMKYIT